MDGCKQMISSKVDAGERLTLEDGLYLYAQDDLLWLGQLALKKKRAISGNQVFFNVNHHINLTNICKSLCRFYAFGRKDEYSLVSCFFTWVGGAPKGNARRS